MAAVLKPSSELTELQELPTKKRGRSLLIGEELYIGKSKFILMQFKNVEVL